MIKTRYSIAKNHTITMKDSFINQIEINANVATITFVNNKKHRYFVDNDKINDLVATAKTGKGIGSWYNQNLKGTSFEKIAQQ